MKIWLEWTYSFVNCAVSFLYLIIIGLTSLFEQGAGFSHKVFPSASFVSFSGLRQAKIMLWSGRSSSFKLRSSLNFWCHKVCPVEESKPTEQVKVQFFLVDSWKYSSICEPLDNTTRCKVCSSSGSISTRPSLSVIVIPRSGRQSSLTLTTLSYDGITRFPHELTFFEMVL